MHVTDIYSDSIMTTVKLLFCLSETDENQSDENEIVNLVATPL